MAIFNIEVIAVGAVENVPTGKGKSYNTVEVYYKKDGKAENKKIVDFTNKEFFADIQKWKAGEQYAVQAEKNEKGFWQWLGVSGNNPSGGSTGQRAAPGGSFTPDKERQAFIIRQSSLGHAVATLAVGSKAIKPEDVIEVAKKYEAFVFGQEAKPATVAELEDDIPF